MQLTANLRDNIYLEIKWKPNSDDHTILFKCTAGWHLSWRGWYYYHCSNTLNYFRFDINIMTQSCLSLLTVLCHYFFISNTATLSSCHFQTPLVQRQDDVWGDAHHQRGHGAEPTRLSEQRLGPGLALRAADGQHAGREGPAPGHTEGDAGEPRPGPAASAGRHLRPWLSAAPAQLRPATGKSLLQMSGIFVTVSKVFHSFHTSYMAVLLLFMCMFSVGFLRSLLLDDIQLAIRAMIAFPRQCSFFKLWVIIF